MASAQSSYGYTSEFQDSYNDLVYLRARHYAPGMGRFLTRDTWNGDANRPLSYNRWMYAYGNPANLSDPTGMKPNLDQYCDPLIGADRLRCQKIMRDLNPRNSMSTIDIYIFDNFGGNYQCEPLFKIMNLPGNNDDGKISESYGFWFHYLLNKKSTTRGGNPVSITTVIAYALSAESKVSSLYTIIMPEMVKAMRMKSQATGVYNAIGSRSVVQSDIHPYLFLANSTTRIQERWESNPGAEPFEAILQNYVANGRDWESELKADLLDEVIKVFPTQLSIDANPNNVPDDWGNATKDTEDMPIWNILNTNLDPNDPQYNLSPNAVYWRSGRVNDVARDEFFIVTPNQRGILCKGFSSCVKK